MIRAGKGTAGARWRARAPIALIVAGCVAVVGIAVGGAAKPLPGLDVVPTGHWIYNSLLGKAFHIDGAGKRADAEVSVPGAGADSQVVQGPTQGYVVSPGKKTVEFGKSTLSVEGSHPAAAPERPVTLEVRGGPYAVYREAGTVSRFGDHAVTVKAGGPLGTPVATPDGRLWLHRLDTGLLCELAPGSERLSCPFVIPQGHKGSLTVVGDTAMFVDTTDDTARTVAVTGLGDPVKLGVEVPETAVAASNDVEGRVAILDPQGARLHLVDAAPQAKTAPVTVGLPPGDYAGVAASRTAVAVVDRTSKTVRTFDRDGRERDKKPIPGEGGKPPVRGQDSKVYVDGVDGSHVLVVEHDGAVNEVPVTGAPDPAQDPKPVAPPPPRNPPDARGPVTQPQPPPVPAGKPDRPVAPQTTKKPPPVAASPPGAPRSVTATPGNASATVRWNAAAANGAAVTGYRVTWSGGETTVGGGARTASITGLANGASYVFTVAAINRAGTGPGASSAPVTPVVPKPPSAPGNVAAQPEGNGGALITWTPATANGSPITGYRIYWCPDSEGIDQPHDPPDCGEATVPASARQHVADFLLVGTELRFYVEAMSAAGNGPAGDDPTIPEGRPDIEVTQRNGMVRLVARTITESANWNATLPVVVTGPGWEKEFTIKLTGQHNTGTDLVRYPGAKGDRVTVTLYTKVYGEIVKTITWK
ncbi:fibronectin type III domain-containing protein [Amycolatopsis sp. cmx-4-54]|uniref:fibronectin type III domain-containing protein n=1 Tax=Amycolatopsis sp. cmx-4-54 TaxID=2790936 RepID=UPI003979722F